MMTTTRARGTAVALALSLVPLAPGAAAAAPADGPVVVRGSTWLMRDSLTSGDATRTVGFGVDGDLPITGDWDGNGTPGIGVVRGGEWLLRENDSTRPAGMADVRFRYGRPGDIPVVGDWDGNGTVTAGVVRGQTWYLNNSNTSGAADIRVSFGRATDVPVAGDWDGDGQAGIGVVRDGIWWLANAPDGSDRLPSFRYGNRGDRFVVGDWDGNGSHTPGTVHTGRWYVTNTVGSGRPDRAFSYGSRCDLALSTSSVLTPPRGGGALRSSQRGTEILTLPTSRKVVALTMDAGANADGIPKILATLRRECVPATFFLSGAWIENYPQQARTVGLAFPVANHTVTHPDLTTLSDAAVRRELTQTQRANLDATRQDDRPMFRFPFGARDSRTLRIVNDLGYASVRWNVDTLGWRGTSGGMSVDAVVDRVLDGLTPGEIVLMHVGSHPQDRSTLDADALPRIIRELHARGYSFVTVDDYT